MAIPMSVTPAIVAPPSAVINNLRIYILDCVQAYKIVAEGLGWETLLGH